MTSHQLIRGYSDWDTIEVSGNSAWTNITHGALMLACAILDGIKYGYHLDLQIYAHQH